MSSLRHVGITVSNLDRSIEFYRDFLGFDVKKIMVESGAGGDGVVYILTIP